MLKANGSTYEFYLANFKIDTCSVIYPECWTMNIFRAHIFADKTFADKYKKLSTEYFEGAKFKQQYPNFVVEAYVTSLPIPNDSVMVLKPNELYDVVRRSSTNCVIAALSIPNITNYPHESKMNKIAKEVVEKSKEFVAAEFSKNLFSEIDKPLSQDNSAQKDDTDELADTHRKYMND
jgi:hypothetical protein